MLCKISLCDIFESYISVHICVYMQVYHITLELELFEETSSVMKSSSFYVGSVSLC